MKKKTTTKRKVKRTVRRKSTLVEPLREKGGLNFMVQVGDPKALRKDLLESLREIIIFMQGYENFRNIQEEKIATFAKLREDIKELNNLVDNKLRKYLPKGKLNGIVEEKKIKQTTEEEPEVTTRVMPETKPETSSVNELDDLEYQLKDIENRLRNIR